MSARGRVLVLDGERFIRDLVEEMLRTEGFEVATAADEAAAVNRLSNERFEVVVADVRFEDSVFAADQIAIRHVPVITMSVSGASTSGRSFSSLTKPFTVESLVESVHRAIAKRNVGRGPVN